MMRGAAAGGGDVTPNAVNWADITSVIGVGSNANQTLAGVSSGILLHFDVTISTGTGTLEYDVNDGTPVAFVDNDTLTWLLGQTLSFTATQSGGIGFTGSVSVKNASAGMVELDSFTFDVSTI